MSNKSLISVVLTASVFLILFSLVHNRHLLRPAEAAGGLGDLDPTFGQSGKVSALFFGNTAVAFAGALQPDGKIIAAGTNATNQGFSLARFNNNGTLDNTFGGGAGKVATTFSPGVSAAFVQALALQSDQKIVAVGIIINSDGSRDFGLVRHLPDGQLDPTFGNSGKLKTTLSGARDEANAVVIQPDGRILVAGRADEEFALVRYNTDGTLDNSFGSSGKTTIDFDGFEDAAHALALQSEGKILIAGQVTFRAGGAASLRQRFGVARCNSDGTLDSTFGTSGKVITDFNNAFLDNQAFSMVVQSDGKPVVGGWTTGPQGGRDFALVRYNTDGSLDSTFGSQGRVTTDFANLGNDTIEALTLQPDGKIIAVGYTDLRIAHLNFAVARYHADGTLDNTFGVGGKTTTNFFFDVFDSQAFAVLLQPNGNIVAVGHARGHFTLARYLGDAAVSPTPTPTPSPTPPPSPTPTPATLRLFLAESPPTPNQVAAIDSVLFLPEPFEVFPQLKLLKPAIDPNTRVIVFVENLQLLPGETASSVIVSLTSTLRTVEIPAEDVRLVPGADFAQVTFRLADDLGDFDWILTVKAQGQVTNSGVLRIFR
jgi:uncharacterized delta-60 repeat protein